jgi:hypothetical protein
MTQSAATIKPVPSSHSIVERAADRRGGRLASARRTLGFKSTHTRADLFSPARGTRPRPPKYPFRYSDTSVGVRPGSSHCFRIPRRVSGVDRLAHAIVPELPYRAPCSAVLANRFDGEPGPLNGTRSSVGVERGRGSLLRPAGDPRGCVLPARGADTGSWSGSFTDDVRSTRSAPMAVQGRGGYAQHRASFRIEKPSSPSCRYISQALDRIRSLLTHRAALATTYASGQLPRTVSQAERPPGRTWNQRLPV